MTPTNHKEICKKAKRLLPVVIERDEEGFFACCPTMQGCYADGDTVKEAVQNIRQVIKLIVEDRLDCGEDIPGGDIVGVMTIQVEV